MADKKPYPARLPPPHYPGRPPFDLECLAEFPEQEWVGRVVFAMRNRDSWNDYQVGVVVKYAKSGRFGMDVYYLIENGYMEHQSLEHVWTIKAST